MTPTVDDVIVLVERVRMYRADLAVAQNALQRALEKVPAGTYVGREGEVLTVSNDYAFDGSYMPPRAVKGAKVVRSHRSFTEDTDDAG